RIPGPSDPGDGRPVQPPWCPGPPPDPGNAGGFPPLRRSGEGSPGFSPAGPAWRRAWSRSRR
ncbi:HTH-type transcriptional regulator immR, partial [Dysosmobacter welbionis]